MYRVAYCTLQLDQIPIRLQNNRSNESIDASTQVLRPYPAVTLTASAGAARSSTPPGLQPFAPVTWHPDHQPLTDPEEPSEES